MNTSTAKKMTGFTVDQEERRKLHDRLQQIERIVGDIDFYLDGNGEIRSRREGKMFEIFHQVKSNPHKLRLAELQAEVSDIRLKLFGKLAWWKSNQAKLNQSLAGIADRNSIDFEKSDSRAPGQTKFKLYLDPDTYVAFGSKEFEDQTLDAGTTYLLVEGHFYGSSELTREQKKHPPILTTRLELHCGDLAGEDVGFSVSCPDCANFQAFDNPAKSLPQGWLRVTSLFRS